MTIRGRMLAERDRIESKFDERERVLRKFTAVLGDGEGNVYPDPNNLQYNFIRRTGRSRVERVRNTRIQAVHGLRVWVGFTPERPDEMQVIDVDDTAYGNALGMGSFAPSHHQQHELHTVGGGGDTTWIWAQQFLHLLCQVTDPISEFLQVRTGIYAYSGAYYIFPGATTVDLTTYAPGAGLAVMVLISIIAGTGNLVYTVSSSFTTALPSDMWPSQVPITPNGTLPVGAIYIPNGATTFDWDYVLDWRIFINVVGDVQPHNIFSTSHPDTFPDTIVRGDLATGLDTVPPKLGRLALGAALEVLRVNAGATDVEWSDALLDYVLRSEWLQNGFVDETEVSLAWNDGTRTLTVDSVGANFNYFHDGILYTRTGPDTETIADTEGMWVFYYDGATLSSLHAPTHAQIDSVIENECIVAYLYWDATNNDGRLMYELHGYRMSPVTHRVWHNAIGSVYCSGMALADFVIDDSGDDNEDAQFSVAQGEFCDEDIEIALAAVGKLVGLEIWYLNVADWRWTTNAGFSIRTDPGTGRMAYNNAGAQAAVGNNNFALCHIFATTIVDDAGANPKYIAIQGQAQYTTIIAARDGADTEINALTYGTLPLQELIPVGTVIFQTANGYANAVKSRTRTTGSGDDYVDWRGSNLKATGGLLTSHSALADLNVPGDHPAYLTLDGVRPMTGNLDLNGNTVIFDGDGDAYMWSPIDDVIDVVVPNAGGEFAININGAEVATFTDDALNILVGSDIIMGEATSIGIGPAAERIEFYGAGHIDIMGANVGIGVTNPSNFVEVSKSQNDITALKIINVTNDTLARAVLRISAGGNGNAYLSAHGAAYAAVPNWADGVSFGCDSNYSAGFHIYTAAVGGINFENVAGTPIMTIVGGQVGIGTTSPSTRLDVDAGAIEFAEMTSPAAGAVNTARLFARDSGGGKTQLCVRFASGAVQVLAVEL